MKEKTMKKTTLLTLLLAVSLTITAVSCNSKKNSITTDNEITSVTEDNISKDNELEEAEKVSGIANEASSTITEMTMPESQTTNDNNIVSNTSDVADVAKETEFYIPSLYDYLGHLNYKDLDEYPLIEGNVNISFVTVDIRTEDGRLMHFPNMYRNENAKSALDALYFQVQVGGEPVYSSYSDGNVIFGTKEQIGKPIEPSENPISFFGIPVRLNCLDYQMDNPPCYMYIETTSKEDTLLNLGKIDNCFVKAIYCNSYDTDMDCQVYFHNNLHVGLDKDFIIKNCMEGLNHFEKDGLLIYRTKINTLCIKFNDKDIATDILLIEDSIDYNTEW